MKDLPINFNYEYFETKKKNNIEPLQCLHNCKNIINIQKKNNVLNYDLFFNMK